MQKSGRKRSGGESVRGGTSGRKMSYTRSDAVSFYLLQYWSDASCLQIVASYQSSRVHLKVGFFRRYHGDASPFDGRGRVLAHAFLPTHGSIHFDNDEYWTHGTTTGRSLGGTSVCAVVVNSLSIKIKHFRMVLRTKISSLSLQHRYLYSFQSGLVYLLTRLQ